MVAAVAIGGALGAVSRLGVSLAVQRLAGEGFPLATLCVNVLGCFVFGVCWGLGGGRWPRLATAGVFTGFLGAFTTFSTFAWEGAELLAQDRPGAAALVLVLHNALGGLAMGAGLLVGRSLS